MMSSLPHNVAAWYDQNVDMEDHRLNLGRLEYAVTLHHIRAAVGTVQKRLGGSRPVRIADIGCGTGAYAIPLAQAGHEVTVCDISAAEIELAKQKAHRTGVQFVHASVFDARGLDQRSSVHKRYHYDIVLLLGPLYHVLDEAERVDLLRQALQTLQPGGSLFAAFVTKNAHLRDVATRDPERLYKEMEFYSRYLDNGQYTRGTNAPMHHTTPQEVRRLLEKVKVHSDMEWDVQKMLSCEGFLGFQHGSHIAELDDLVFDRWLTVILASAEDETNLGAADHLLIILQNTV